MADKDLEYFLEQYRGCKVDFFRFRGNYGDSLIWHGTMILLSGLAIEVENVELGSEVNNNVLIIDGGGNFVDYYSDVRDFITAKHHHYQNIIFLPHTINGDKQVEILGILSANTTIFCRENESFQFVQMHAKNCAVYTWHDCAFYNDLSAIITKGDGVLNAFRKDKESQMQAIPENNTDISYNGYATKPLHDFLQPVNSHHTINTDRLHVAIAGAMLNKNVNLYPNSYYKNKAVFDYSLNKYPGVNFINDNK